MVITYEPRTLNAEPESLPDHNLFELCGGITKAYALQRFSENLGLKREEIAAIGDQHNDIDLIEYAGLGIAVANAEDALKEKADIVMIANNNESAVSEAIANYLLN